MRRRRRMYRRGEDDEGVCSCEDVCRPPSANIASSTSHYSTAVYSGAAARVACAR